MPHLPHIHLIATGGTIAGTAPDPTDTRHYTAGTLTAEQLLTSAPPLKDLASISVEQLYSLDSKDMTPDHWLGLARATQIALSRGEVDGVVITHGTDTLEESAFFLDLVLPPGKPVVFTGAMRPATALSADGPMNLFQAVNVAIHPDFHGRGVLVVMNDEVHGASHVTKTRSGGSARFTSPRGGPLGLAHPPRISLDLKHAPAPPPDITHIHTLPRVDIVFVAAGTTPELLNAAIALGAQGIVLILPGAAGLPSPWVQAIERARQAQIAIVEMPRAGIAEPITWGNSPPHSIHSPLTPLQARIALMLTLAANKHR